MNEEEVDEQVSTIKRKNLSRTRSSSAEFGIENASFQWNSTKEDAKSDKKDTQKASDGDSERAVDPIQASEDNSSSITDDSRTFELKDITVSFPEGKLSVITGPTASGKTALLASKQTYL